MAQRKPKESLIAEIPKPRLTDAELMEMFYGGERRNTARVAGDETLLDSLESDPVLLPRVAKGITESHNQPTILEPLIKEPSNEKPFVLEPFSREPIKKERDSTTPSSINKATLSSDPLEKHPETEIIPSRQDPAILSLSEDNASSQSLQGVTTLPINNQKTEIYDDYDHERLTAKPYIDFPKKDSFNKGSSKEGIFKEGLSTSNVVPAAGEVLKKAFDVLPMLPPLEQLMYLWFLNMSHEVGRESCRATMSLLQRATGISEKLVRENIRSLSRKGCLDLLDGGAAGKAALYRVALPVEAADAIIEFKGSNTKGSVQESSSEKPAEKLTSTGNLPIRNLPSHIERETFSNTLSNNKEPSLREPSPEKGSLTFSLPTKIADSVIDRFYSMTGQTRISRQKRERSRLQLLDLMQQGFQVDDVLYAIEWARGNISGPIHSFGLIPEIIGQAISRRSGTTQGQKPRQERSTDQRSSKSDAEIEKEQKEHERFEAIYTALSSEEQNAIRSEALLLVESEFGSHVPGQQTLVRIKLMEILRERYAEQGLLERKGG